MRGVRGFTLIEILVAMAIFTIIGVASTGVLSSVIDSDELSSEQFEKLQQLQRAMLVIERDFLQAIKRPMRIQGEAVEVVFSSQKNLLDSDGYGVGFIRAGRENPQWMLRRSTLQGVAYRLREEKLERLYDNYVDNIIGHEPKIRILLEDVEDFRLEFIPAGEKEPEDPESWRESYVGTTLPQAVAVIITHKDFGTLRREFLLPAEGS